MPQTVGGEHSSPGHAVRHSGAPGVRGGPQSSQRGSGLHGEDGANVYDQLFSVNRIETVLDFQGLLVSPHVHLASES